jgi:hypothetical protein
MWKNPTLTLWDITQMCVFAWRWGRVSVEGGGGLKKEEQCKKIDMTHAWAQPCTIYIPSTRWSTVSLLSFGWLIDCLLFTSCSRIFHLYCQWRAAQFRPMLGAQSLWAGRDPYRATQAVTRDLGFSVLIRKTAPFSRLLYDTHGGVELDPHGLL